MAKSRFSDAHKRLRDLLIAARQAAGATQTDVADRLGRPQSFISKVETGERHLDVVEFIEFAEAVGADPVALMESLSTLVRTKASRLR